MLLGLANWFKVPTLALATLACAYGQASGMGTQTLSAVLQAAAKLSVPSSVTLSAGNGYFASYSGTLVVAYRTRTTSSGGGAITMSLGTDFVPTGGPSAASGALTYICSGATQGTACPGTQTAAVGSQTPVLTLPASACTGGGGPCSSSDPNSLTLQFTLPNDPSYSTGSYSAQITFVISAI